MLALEKMQVNKNFSNVRVTFTGGQQGGGQQGAQHDTQQGTKMLGG